MIRLFMTLCYCKCPGIIPGQSYDEKLLLVCFGFVVEEIVIGNDIFITTTAYILYTWRQYSIARCNFYPRDDLVGKMNAKERKSSGGISLRRVKYSEAFVAIEEFQISGARIIHIGKNDPESFYKRISTCAGYFKNNF